MAYIDLTLLNALQTDDVQRDFQKQRFGLLRATDVSTARSPIITEQVRAFLSQTNDQAIEIPALEEGVITTTTSESFTIPANLTVSQKITATKVTVFAGFHHFPAAFGSNMVSKERYFQHKIDEVGKAMAKSVAGTILAKLEAKKTQVMTGANDVIVAGFNFNTILDVLEVTKAAQESNFFGNLRNLADSNFIGEDLLMVVNDLGLTQTFTKWFQNGGDQAINIQNRMNMPIPNWDSKEIPAPGAGSVGTAFLMKNGALGTIENFTFDFVNRTKTSQTSWDISGDVVPFLEKRVGTMFRTLDEDGTNIPAGSTGSITATAREEYGFVYKFFLLDTYNQDLATRQSDVIKIDLKST